MTMCKEQADEAREISRWHEQYIKHLLNQSGQQVLYEPRINGKTPDLVVTQPGQPDVIIECMARLKDPSHERELFEQGLHVCGGDLSKLYCNLYSRVEEKTTKYRSIVDGHPYVLSIYDDSCLNFLSTANALAFSDHVPYVTLNADGPVVDRSYHDTRYPQDRHLGLFQRYPHLSGLLYSHSEKKHYFLPNPFATVPVSTDLFPFACVPEAPIINGRPAWKQRAQTMTDNYPSAPNVCQPQYRTRDTEPALALAAA